jgi:transcriptional regulator with XRE-family HTH domain
MPLTFYKLRARLLLHLRERVRSGEVSERSLARITGISQPHLHQVLNGTKVLSLEKADQILRHLHLDLLDLIKPDD